MHIDFHMHLAFKETESIYDKARDSRHHHPFRVKPIQLLSVEELVVDFDQASIDQRVFRSVQVPFLLAIMHLLAAITLHLPLPQLVRWKRNRGTFPGEEMRVLPVQTTET